MSNEARDYLNHQYQFYNSSFLSLSHEDPQNAILDTTNFFPFSNNNPNSSSSSSYLSSQILQGGFTSCLDPPNNDVNNTDNYLMNTFNDFLQGSSMNYPTLPRSVGVSPTSSEVFSSVVDAVGGDEKPPTAVKEKEGAVIIGGGENPGTPNSSISSSSTEAADDASGGKKDDRHQSKVSDDQGRDDESKKGLVYNMLNY